MMQTIAQHQSFAGTVTYYQHWSEATQCNMRFSVYLPRLQAQQQVPVLYFLSGLTCNEETFMIKAGAQRYAAEHGIMLVAPDTSPRGEDVPDDDAWDFAQGAGFYLNATQSPWDKHYRMYDYVVDELPALIEQEFPVDAQRKSIFGHSMGGHGALTIYLKNIERYRSVSAFAPICAPMQCPWGASAYKQYLGDDRENWKQYDACELLGMLQDADQLPEVLIDQGTSDQFLQRQLHPHLFEQIAKEKKLKLSLRRHEGYDHGYFFIATFMRDHIEHHAKILCQ